ncbi:unnamed protein product [Agarophyton chilense]
MSVEEALKSSSNSLSGAVSLLWKLDTNRLVADKDYVISPQHRTDHRSDDAARVPLFEFFSEDVWEINSYKLFRRLLDNYVVKQGVPERVSEEEKEEEERFLECICESDCLRFVFKWLCENGYEVASSMDDFREVLGDLWFGMYGRGRSRDSSAFEHVFCGEIAGDDVKGLHNYIQVYIEEQRGNFDYMGYVDFQGDFCDSAPLSNQQVLIIRFRWFGCLKSVSSMFIGTSPEFEIAMYTLLWFSRDQGSHVESDAELGPYLVQLRIYEFDSKITSAFPCLQDVDTEQLKRSCEGRRRNENGYDGIEQLGGEEEDEDELEQFDEAVLHDPEEFPPLG